jgi:hypothetical protein
MIGKSARAAFGSTMRIWGVSSAGRAPALQAGGHRFDPGTLHKDETPASYIVSDAGARASARAFTPNTRLNGRKGRLRAPLSSQRPISRDRREDPLNAVDRAGIGRCAHLFGNYGEGAELDRRVVEIENRKPGGGIGANYDAGCLQRTERRLIRVRRVRRLPRWIPGRAPANPPDHEGVDGRRRGSGGCRCGDEGHSKNGE